MAIENSLNSVDECLIRRVDELTIAIRDLVTYVHDLRAVIEADSDARRRAVVQSKHELSL